MAEHKTLRILVVEDSPTQAKAVALALEDEGFSVATAAAAEEGFARLLTEQFDVVLTDLLLPGADGIVLCQRIGQDAVLRHLPVVLLTSVDDESLAREAMQSGAQDYLVKGEVNNRWMARALKFAIERKRVKSAAHEAVPPEAATGPGSFDAEQREGIWIVRPREARLVGDDVLQSMREQLNRLLGPVTAPRVVFDLQHVEYLSNLAMGVLVSVDQKVTALGGKLHLCNLGPEVAANVASRKLDRVFKIFDHQQSALGSF